MITKILYIENDDGQCEIESYSDLDRFGVVTANDIFESHIVITDRGRIFKNRYGNTSPVNSFDLVVKPKSTRQSKYRSIFEEDNVQQEFIAAPEKEQLEEKKPVYLSIVMKFLPVTLDELNVGDFVYYKIKNQSDDNAHGPFTVYNKEKLLILTESKIKVKVSDRLELLKLDYLDIK
jgi:hypothetical protein